MYQITRMYVLCLILHLGYSGTKYVANFSGIAVNLQSLCVFPPQLTDYS
jgi:hypothetical protein